MSSKEGNRTHWTGDGRHGVFVKLQAVQSGWSIKNERMMVREELDDREMGPYKLRTAGTRERRGIHQRIFICRNCSL